MVHRVGSLVAPPAGFAVNNLDISLNCVVRQRSVAGFHRTTTRDLPSPPRLTTACRRWPVLELDLNISLGDRRPAAWGDLRRSAVDHRHLATDHCDPRDFDFNCFITISTIYTETPIGRCARRLTNFYRIDRLSCHSDVVTDALIFIVILLNFQTNQLR